MIIRPMTDADAVEVSALMLRSYDRVLVHYHAPEMLAHFAEHATPESLIEQLGRKEVFVAEDAGRIVGWCDVSRERVPTYAHEGMLGMGVLADYRGRGLGERLIRAALAAAAGAGFERISLSVYGSNTRATALYRKVGFALEGTRVRGRKLDGVYDDVHMMALFTSPGSVSS